MRLKRCQHLNARCIHGDEGWVRMKVFLRWWKEPIVFRQSCLDCGGRLDRDPICSRFPNRHTFHGDWTEADR